MRHRAKTILISAALLGVLLVAGIVGVSLQAEEAPSYRPNDRANHHPVNPDQ
jgi:hypothetical protein